MEQQDLKIGEIYHVYNAGDIEKRIYIGKKTLAFDGLYNKATYEHFFALESDYLKQTSKATELYYFTNVFGLSDVFSTEQEAQSYKQECIDSAISLQRDEIRDKITKLQAELLKLI